MNIEMILFTDVIVFSRRRSSSKKLVVVKQLHFLDKVQFHKSEVSSTSLVVIYLDEYGMLANSMMIEMTEESRDTWMEAVSKAQVEDLIDVKDSFLLCLASEGLEFGVFAP